MLVSDLEHLQCVEGNEVAGGLAVEICRKNRWAYFVPKDKEKADKKPTIEYVFTQADANAYDPYHDPLSNKKDQRTSLVVSD